MWNNSVCVNQSDQNGRFFKGLGNQYSYKRGQNILKLFGHFWKHRFLRFGTHSTFEATFGKNLATFYSDIWSHCPCVCVIRRVRDLKKETFVKISRFGFCDILVNTIITMTQILKKPKCKISKTWNMPEHAFLLKWLENISASDQCNYQLFDMLWWLNFYKIFFSQITKFR